MIIHNFYDGLLYKVEYKPELSKHYYTQRRVYHIETEDENYTHAHKAIESIMNDNSWKKGVWVMKNKQQPSMANALHTYHEFSYDDKIDKYVYILVRPYDD